MNQFQCISVCWFEDPRLYPFSEVCFRLAMSAQVQETSVVASSVSAIQALVQRLSEDSLSLPLPPILPPLLPPPQHTGISFVSTVIDRQY